MADQDPLETLLGELQKDRPKTVRAHIRAAQALVDRAHAEFPDSTRVVCVEHELITARSYLDEEGYAKDTLEVTQRVLDKGGLTSNCQLCMLSAMTDAQMALRDFEAARATLAARIKICEDTDTVSALTSEAFCHLKRVQLAALEGDATLAKVDAARHDKHALRTQTNYDRFKDDYPDWHKKRTQCITEMLAEVRILVLIAEHRFKGALTSIRAYMDEHGDGDIGMALVMHILVTRVAAARDWAMLIEASDLVLDEFKRRGHLRWLALLLLDNARAHHALDNRREARILLYQIDDIRGELASDDLANPIEALESALRA